MSERRPLGIWLRFASLVALFVAAALVLRSPSVRSYLDQEHLIALLESVGSHPLAPAGHVLALLVLCPLGAPATPLVLAGGAVFGAWLGALLNFVGLLAGATATFLIGRGLGRGVVERLLGSRLELANRVVKRHGFWTLVRLRFVPVPFVVTNLGAALGGVRLATFVVTTAIGLLPTMLIYSYLAASLMTAATGASEVVGEALVAMALFLTLSFVPTIGRGLLRRRRYLKLVTERRERGRS